MIVAIPNPVLHRPRCVWDQGSTQGMPGSIGGRSKPVRVSILENIMGSKRGVARGAYRKTTDIEPLTAERVCAAIKQERGSIFHTALALGTTRTRVERFLAKNTKVIAAYREAHEDLGDLAERKLYQLIEAGDVRCILWYLSTKHAARGYGKEQTELPFGEEQRRHVSTVNIIAIPNGRFLSREEARAMTVDMVPIKVVSNGHSRVDRGDDGVTGAADAAERDAGAVAETSSIFD